jgi:outer membrane lipoprotein carrier protein
VKQKAVDVTGGFIRFALKCAVLFLLAGTSLLFGSPVQAHQHRTSDADAVLRKVESRYGRLKSLAAEFEQTYFVNGMPSRRERGRLFLQRPGRMRWEYDSNKLFVVNQRDVWLYIPADRQATHSDTRSISDSRFPFLFLLGRTNIRSGFSSVEFLHTENGSPGIQTLRLIPRRRDAGLRELFLTCDNEGRISSVRMVEGSGTTSEVLLRNTQENAGIVENAFDFQPPPGVKVLRQM